jgi:hypothetical protein
LRILVEEKDLQPKIAMRLESNPNSVCLLLPALPPPRWCMACSQGVGRSLELSDQQNKD